MGVHILPPKTQKALSEIQFDSRFISQMPLVNRKRTAERKLKNITNHDPAVIRKKLSEMEKIIASKKRP